jgi:type I restriction enzyme M protein
MLTDPNLRSQVDALWDKLWTGGLSNPLDAIEQLSFLLFLKRLDEAEQDRERDIGLHRTKRGPIFPDPKLRWSYWTNLKADEALKHVKEKVFIQPTALGNRQSKKPLREILRRPIWLESEDISLHGGRRPGYPSAEHWRRRFR